MISGSIGGFLVFLVPVFHHFARITACWYRAAQVRADVPMVPVGTRWDRWVTGYTAVGAAVTRKVAGLPVTRWLEPRCTALVQRLARWCRAGAGGWFKANSPVSPVVHHRYYPVLPGGAPASSTRCTAGITRRCSVIHHTASITRRYPSGAVCRRYYPAVHRRTALVRWLACRRRGLV